MRRTAGQLHNWHFGFCTDEDKLSAGGTIVLANGQSGFMKGTKETPFCGEQENARLSLMSTPAIAPASDRADIPQRFRHLASEWKEQSRYLSNSAQMAMLKPFQQIIGMGWSAVPLILEELQREPDQWFWALEAITDANPVPSEAAGNARLMARAWVEWGKRQGLLKA